jgi:hypothetical protein
MARIQPRQVAHRKPMKEKTMEAPQQEVTEKTEQMDDDADAVMEAAMSKVAENQGSVRAAADAEERAMAERVQGARAAERAAEQMEAAQRPEVVEEEPQDIASIAARGREYLMDRMRQHQEEQTAREVGYVPPPMSAGMRDRINEELEAGRKTQAKHEAQKANRPAPDINENERKAEGSNAPVMRPGNMVTDPRAPSGKEGLRAQRQ